MSTCFIFFDTQFTAQDTLPEAFFAVCLDDAGEVDVALAKHTIDELRAMQAACDKTVIVLATSVASIYTLTLPKLNAKKAREAIPYALEDLIAEPISDVHIAFFKVEKTQNIYRIAVLNRFRFLTWLHVLDELELNFDAVTLDWCALNPHEVLLTDSNMLVCNPGDDAKQSPLHGALSSSFAKQYLDTAEQVSGLVFDDSLQDSVLKPLVETFDKQKGSFRLFVATRLLRKKYLNLCQGALKRKPTKKRIPGLFKFVAAAVGIWYVTVLAVNGYILLALYAKEKAVDAKIETLYRKFFPDEKKVVNPKFRIERLIRDVPKASASSFSVLLDKLSEATHVKPVQIQYIRYQNNVLHLRLTVERFSMLEAFIKQLEMQQIKVKQISTSIQQSMVFATLELSL